MADTNQIGEISIAENGKSGNIKGAAKRFVFAGSQQVATLRPTTDGAFQDLDLCVYPVAYTLSNGDQFSYFKYLDAIYFISTTSTSSCLVYKRILDDPEDEIEVINAIEDQFGGHVHNAITMSPEEIKNKYGKEGNLKLYVLIGLITVLGIASYFAFSGEEPPVEPSKPVEQPPLVLSPKHEAFLKEQASMAFLEEIAKKGLEISSDPFLMKHSRIKSFVLSSVQRGGDTPGEYPPVLATGELHVEHDIAFEGSKKSGDGIYMSDSTLTGKAEARDYSSQETTKDMSLECVKMMYEIDKSLFVESRTNNTIIFGFENVHPNHLLKTYTKIQRECPIYLDKLTGSDDKYTGSIALYSKEKL